MAAFERVVVITKKTALEELIERFNTREQSRFYLEHMGISFEEYQNAHETYFRSVDHLRESLPKQCKRQFIEKSFLATYQFFEKDLVVTIGQDGLVINTAKYLNGQPIVAINPDAKRIDGVLATFNLAEASQKIHQALTTQTLQIKKISMAQARLNDGQTLYAVNDLFIGPQSHTSARYEVRLAGKSEIQSSSGIIVSTGAGSTGWLQSIVTGSVSITGGLVGKNLSAPDPKAYKLDWESNELYFSVREPFISKTSKAEIVFGKIHLGQHLQIISQMPERGVIFSDGIERDFLDFNSGAIASIGLSDRKACLVMNQ